MENAQLLKKALKTIRKEGYTFPAKVLEITLARDIDAYSPSRCAKEALLYFYREKNGHEQARCILMQHETHDYVVAFEPLPEINDSYPALEVPTTFNTNN